MLNWILQSRKIIINDGAGDALSPFESTRGAADEKKFKFNLAFIRDSLKDLCENNWFTFIINTSIVVNTFILSYD